MFGLHLHQRRHYEKEKKEVSGAAMRAGDDGRRSPQRSTMSRICWIMILVAPYIWILEHHQEYQLSSSIVAAASLRSRKGDDEATGSVNCTLVVVDATLPATVAKAKDATKEHQSAKENLQAPEKQKHVSTGDIISHEDTVATVDRLDHQDVQSAVRRKKKKKSRLLLGIFTMDEGGNGRRYRHSFRSLLHTLYPRVCMLHEFQMQQQDQHSSESSSSSSNLLDTCEVVYTFVLGVTPSDKAASLSNTKKDDPSQSPKSIAAASLPPTFLFDASLRPITVDPSRVHPLERDHAHDMTWLNIAENMNEGKSPTWLYYASLQPGFDYVAKMDTDTMPLMDLFFRFKQQYLPPLSDEDSGFGTSSPNKNSLILAGRFASPFQAWGDEELQKSVKGNDMDKVFRGQFYSYAVGEFYILSTELCRLVGEEGRRHGPEFPSNVNYFVELEDHDVSAMAFVAATRRQEQKHRVGASTTQQPPPTIQMLPMPGNDHFWRHPVKASSSRFEKYWERELDRIRNKTQRDLYHLIAVNDTIPRSCSGRGACVVVLNARG